MKQKFNYLFCITLVLLFLFSIVYATNVLNGKDISYNNNTSSLESTNIQDAIDELYKLKTNSSSSVTNEYNAEDISVSTSYNQNITNLKEAFDDLYVRFKR